MSVLGAAHRFRAASRCRREKVGGTPPHPRQGSFDKLRTAAPLPRTSFLPLLLGCFALSLACAADTRAPGTGPTAPAEEAAPATAAPTAPAGAAADATATSGDGGRLTLNAVGDLMLARDIVTLMDGRGSLYPFAAVRELLADADVTVANLEGTFTERGTAADKFYTFRTPPRHARGLAEAGIDVVSLGNNHSMDFGGIGLADTLAALDAAGLRYSGAGEDEAAARRPALLTVRGLRLAFLSYSAVSESTPAGTGRPGVAWGEAAAVGADVRAARAHADVVIVSLHAGNEYQDAPSGTQRALAQAAIEAGALLVLGHHAHVLQGWERYNGGPSTGPSASSGGTSGQALVVYGLGNFVFDLDSDDLATLGPRPFQSCVLHIVLTRNAVESVGCRPVRIDPIEDRPRSAAGEAAREIEARVEMLNAGLR